MLANAFQQCGLDRSRIRVRVGPAREADRAEAAAAGWRHRSGRGIEIAVVARLDPIGEQLEHRLLVDHGGGQDARARSVAGDFADSEPLAAGER